MKIANLKENQFGWMKTRTLLGGFLNVPGQTNGTVEYEMIIFTEEHQVHTSHFGTHITILEKYVDVNKMKKVLNLK